MTKRQMSAEGWAQFARLAYAGYKAKARGAIIVDALPLVSPDPNDDKGSAARYLTRAELEAQDWLAGKAQDDVLCQVDRYDPAAEVVFVGRGLRGEIVVEVRRADDPHAAPRALYEQLVRSVGLGGIHED